jgi:TrmH family RNA methyltransferase
MSAPLEDITSAQNPLVKLARSLERKKARLEAGLFLTEGARHVTEGLDTGWKLQALLLSAAAAGRPQVAALAARAQAGGARVARVSERILESLTHRDNAQNVIGLFAIRWSELAQLAGARRLIALERPRDPGNLGTIIRLADSTGCGGVVLLEEGCDPFSVECVRASMGSLFAVPVVRCGVAAFDAWRRAEGLTLIGTSLEGSVRHTDVETGVRTCILMGNEQSGLPPDIASLCDGLVRLPMAGRADSLNLALATAVTVYEVWRRSGFDGARF